MKFVFEVLFAADDDDIRMPHSGGDIASGLHIITPALRKLIVPIPGAGGYVFAGDNHVIGRWLITDADQIEPLPDELLSHRIQ